MALRLRLLVGAQRLFSVERWLSATKTRLSFIKLDKLSLKSGQNCGVRYHSILSVHKLSSRAVPAWRLSPVLVCSDDTHSSLNDTLRALRKSDVTGFKLHLHYHFSTLALYCERFNVDSLRAPRHGDVIGLKQPQDSGCTSK